MIYTTEKAIKDLGDKVSDADKTEANNLINELKKALEGNDIDDIKVKTEKLKEKAMALSSSVYEELSKAQNATNANESSTNDGEAEEAEFVDNN